MKVIVEAEEIDYEEVSEQKSLWDYFSLVFGWFFLGCIICFVILLIDFMIGSPLAMKFISSSHKNCKVVLRKDFRLMYSEKNKVYIIADSTKGEFGQWLSYNPVLEYGKMWYKDINSPTEFKDSCSAKDAYVNFYNQDRYIEIR